MLVFVEEAKDLRLLLGVIPAIGQGVKVTLERCRLRSS